MNNSTSSDSPVAKALTLLRRGYARLYAAVFLAQIRGHSMADYDDVDYVPMHRKRYLSEELRLDDATRLVNESARLVESAILYCPQYDSYLAAIKGVLLSYAEYLQLETDQLSLWKRLEVKDYASFDDHYHQIQHMRKPAAAQMIRTSLISLLNMIQSEGPEITNLKDGDLTHIPDIISFLMLEAIEPIFGFLDWALAQENGR